MRNRSEGAYKSIFQDMIYRNSGEYEHRDQKYEINIGKLK